MEVMLIRMALFLRRTSCADGVKNVAALFDDPDSGVVLRKLLLFAQRLSGERTKQQPVDAAMRDNHGAVLRPCVDFGKDALHADKALLVAFSAGRAASTEIRPATANFRKGQTVPFAAVKLDEIGKRDQRT